MLIWNPVSRLLESVCRNLKAKLAKMSVHVEESPCVHPVHAPRELARRHILPSTLQVLTKKIGPLVAMYRVDCAVLLKFLRDERELVHIRLEDDKVCTVIDGDNGRPDDGETIHPSLLNAIPLCNNSECGRGCGCRCSHDLGYTSPEIKLETRVWPGGEVLRCKTPHEKKHITVVRDFPLPLNVDRMVSDLAARF